MPSSVSNCLLFLTLFSPMLTGSTFSFLHVIALTQVFEGVLSIIASSNLSLGLYLSNMIQEIAIVSLDAVKLMVCMLAFFLTLDRFLAICLPSKYSTVNTRKFFGLSVVISLLVSCLEIEYLTEFKITTNTNWENKTEYLLNGPNAWGLLYVHERYIVHVIMVIRVIVLLSMIIFGGSIVHKLRQRGRQVANMMSADAAKKRIPRNG